MEQHLRRIEDKLDNLRTNDLVHIYSRLSSLEGKQTILITLITGVLVGIIITLFK